MRSSTDERSPPFFKKDVDSRTAIFHMNRPLLYILSAILILGLNSCDIINPEEQIPSYVQVDDITLFIPNGNAGTLGSDSENITDVWLYVDNQLIGAFELPALIPVLAQGSQNIKAFAGIKVNGISNDRRVYPFYAYYEVNMELIPGAVNELNPVVEYISEALAIDQERFEDIGFLFVRSAGSDTLVDRISNPDPEFDYLQESVGVVYMDEERPHFKIESNMDLNIAYADPTYVEFDYKCNNEFIFGLKGIQPSNVEVGLIGMNPKLDDQGNPTWNKMYIDISNAVDLIGNGTEIELYFEGQLSGTEGYVMIDNVKIIRPG